MTAKETMKKDKTRMTGDMRTKHNRSVGPLK